MAIQITARCMIAKANLQRFFFARFERLGKTSQSP
jgi:hypothetical protein